MDTHARTHTLVVTWCSTGAQVATSTFPTTPGGLARAVAWIGRRTQGFADVLVLIEGALSYGALLAKSCTESGYRVAEAFASTSPKHKGQGKNDLIDAALIGRAALGQDMTSLRNPRDEQGIRGALRVLTGAREMINRERTRAINALTALLRTVDLGMDARRPLSPAQVEQVSCWRSRKEALATATARREAIRLAKRISSCDVELKENRQELTTLIAASNASSLVNEPGIGAINAAVILTAWSHQGRIHSEAAFASLCGASPLQASSGNTTRHRLNRGGDRRLNKALSSIALTRMSHHQPTRDYVQRRRSEGLTNKEIRRCLKRYIARQ